MDKFYTPSHIASSLLNHVSVTTPSIIADFSAGNGDLLAAAFKRWPSSRFLANDFDATAISNLRSVFPRWLVSRCNFLNRQSRNGSSLLRSIKGSAGLVLLNPPFSCRGGSKHFISFMGESVSCSTALAFLIEALPYLHPEGELLAILPRGTLKSEKDCQAWTLLKKHFSVKLLESFPRQTFSGCYPHTVLIKIYASNSSAKVSSLNLNHAPLSVFKIVRGTQQMHKLDGRSLLFQPNFLPLLHTTKLRGNPSPVCWIPKRQGLRTIKAPAVLIPRVGEPNREKICYYLDAEEAVISDCIFAVECPDGESAYLLREYLNTNWDLIQGYYQGTCAKYLTQRNLGYVLSLVESELSQIMSGQQEILSA